MGPCGLLAQAAPPVRDSRGVEVHEATITDLQRALTEGRVTALVLVDAYLARIAAYDHRGPELNTMIRLNPNARGDARRLDEERRCGGGRGPLARVPGRIK